MSWKLWNLPMERDGVRPKRDPQSDLLRFAAVSAGDKVYYFGGVAYDGTSYDTDQIDVSVFNTVTLRWLNFPPVTTRRGGRRPLEVPSMRFDHTAVLIESIIYIWGGVYCKKIQNAITGGYWDNSLYTFDVDTHTWLKIKLSGFVPEGRSGHSACILGNIMYVFGGYSKTGFLLNDITKLDTTTMVWALITTRGTPPLVSELHSSTVIGTKMFVFGGGAGTKNYNHISVFDTVNNSWLTTPSAQLRPEGRWGHSALAYKEELYIFGGYINSNKYQVNDVWKLNPDTLCWKKVRPKRKSETWRSAICFSLVGDRVILFGAYTARSKPIIRILDLSPSLKTLCNLAVTQYGLEQKGLPHNIRWELAAMTTGRKRKR